MKLLFFDIDGTLITDDGRRYIPQSTYDAIRKARENGHKAFINTGRCNSFIRDIHREIGFDGYVCGCGTEIIIDGKSVKHNTLTHEFCLELAEKIVKKDIPCLFEGSEYTVKLIDGKLTYLDNDIPFDIYDKDFIYDKVSMYKTNVDDELLQYMEKTFTVIYRELDCIYENVPKGFSKATGMEDVAKHYGLTLDDCIAFGDSENDIAMLKAAGYAVTMGRCPDVDKYADFVTQSVENDGIYLAMKHLELI